MYLHNIFYTASQHTKAITLGLNPLSLKLSDPEHVAMVVIEILFAMLRYGFPVHYEWDIQEHIMAKCKGPWHAA